MRNTIHREIHRETRRETNRELPGSPGRLGPAGRRGGRASGPGVMRRLAGTMDARVGIVVAALGCPAALFIPWLTLDAHAGPLSGVGLMSYALQGNDRIVMWQISPVATALLLSLPFSIALGALDTAWSALRRRHRAGAPLLTIAGVLALLRFTPPVLDGGMHTLGGFAAPGPGLGILLASSVAVIALGYVRRRRSVTRARHQGL